jgi:hypothetical protein
MYDSNPFRQSKKIYENMSPEEIATYKKQLSALIDPIGAKYGNPMAQNRESMRAALASKRKQHEEMVRKGELTQSEFDRLEKMGEFDIKEAYDHFVMGPTPEEDPRFQDYEAEEDHHENTKNALLKFLEKDPHSSVTRRVKSEIHRAKIDLSPHGGNESLVRVAGNTFKVDHKTGQVKVVS